MIKIAMESLLGNAVYVGNRKMYRSNAMNRFLIGYRNDICLINLSKTVYMLKRALKMFELIVSKRGYVIFGGVELGNPFDLEFYSEFYLKYVWYGGSLTNLLFVNKLVVNAIPKSKRIASILVLLGESISKYYILNEAVCKVIPSIALIDSDNAYPGLAVYLVPSCNKLTGIVNFYIKLFKQTLTTSYKKEAKFLLEKLKLKKLKKKIVKNNKNYKNYKKL